jgi:hypothetical protein
VNPRAARRFVAYYRVSTDRQGRSGLGLEAQQTAVMDFLNGGPWELVGEFVEVESGRRSDRPELTRAIDACRKHKARLVIAKLDRLSRNLAFVATLMDSGVEFVAVDNPQLRSLGDHDLPKQPKGQPPSGYARARRHKEANPLDGLRTKLMLTANSTSRDCHPVTVSPAMA